MIFINEIWEVIPKGTSIHWSDGEMTNFEKDWGQTSYKITDDGLMIDPGDGHGYKKTYPHDLILFLQWRKIIFPT